MANSPGSKTRLEKLGSGIVTASFPVIAGATLVLPREKPALRLTDPDLDALNATEDIT
jgi:hypothetical protein